MVKVSQAITIKQNAGGILNGQSKNTTFYIRLFQIGKFFRFHQLFVNLFAIIVRGKC